MVATGSKIINTAIADAMDKNQVGLDFDLAAAKLEATKKAR